MARICFYGVSTVCLRKSVMIERTKDKTMIVLTPAMVAVAVAVGCAEVGCLEDSRCSCSPLYSKYWRLDAITCEGRNGISQTMLSE